MLSIIPGVSFLLHEGRNTRERQTEESSKSKYLDCVVDKLVEAYEASIITLWEILNCQSRNKHKQYGIVLILHSMGLSRSEIQSLVPVSTISITRLRQFGPRNTIVQDPRFMLSMKILLAL